MTPLDSTDFTQVIEMFPDGSVSAWLCLEFLADDVIQILDLSCRDLRLSLQTTRDGKQDKTTMF